MNQRFGFTEANAPAALEEYQRRTLQQMRNSTRKRANELNEYPGSLLETADSSRLLQQHAFLTIRPAGATCQEEATVSYRVALLTTRGDHLVYYESYLRAGGLINRFSSLGFPTFRTTQWCGV